MPRVQPDLNCFSFSQSSYARRGSLPFGSFERSPAIHETDEHVPLFSWKRWLERTPRTSRMDVEHEMRAKRRQREKFARKNPNTTKGWNVIVRLEGTTGIWVVQTESEKGWMKTMRRVGIFRSSSPCMDRMLSCIGRCPMGCGRVDPPSLASRFSREVWYPSLVTTHLYPFDFSRSDARVVRFFFGFATDWYPSLRVEPLRDGSRSVPSPAPFGSRPPSDPGEWDDSRVPWIGSPRMVPFRIGDSIRFVPMEKGWGTRKGPQPTRQANRGFFGSSHHHHVRTSDVDVNAPRADLETTCSCHPRGWTRIDTLTWKHAEEDDRCPSPTWRRSSSCPLERRLGSLEPPCSYLWCR